ncbi:unnamed protein product [Meloidogyne enterolobii]|uniref:Uncharacterized protein n=1 Tax=Meloidogyne enterolobii TaxID=390850 RepID=A0ACB0ZLB4_MELEN
MSETWLQENQRLVSQDNFGTDLASVEAANKKHEAIETDIYACEERVQAVISIAGELEIEKYHDIGRINDRKEHVLRLWNQLLELLKGRRQRLELSLTVQKIFNEMDKVLAMMDELRAKLDSDELGQHVKDVEELLQKHTLLESDLNIIADHVKNVNRQAERFSRDDTEGYKHVDPAVVRERMQFLEQTYKKLFELAAARKARLEDNKRLCQFNWGMWENRQQLLSQGLNLQSFQENVKQTEEEENAQNLKKRKGTEQGTM